jgi:putative endonuclease
MLVKNTENTEKTGERGERMAVIYLEKKGYFIFKKNINFSNQEIDIIARLGTNYYIVEVKTSSHNSKTSPEDYFNQRKLKNLKIAAYSFSRKNKIKLELIYIDLITVKLHQDVKKATIKHYKNIC